MKKTAVGARSDKRLECRCGPMPLPSPSGREAMRGRRWYQVSLQHSGTTDRDTLDGLLGCAAPLDGRGQPAMTGSVVFIGRSQVGDREKAVEAMLGKRFSSGLPTACAHRVAGARNAAAAAPLQPSGAVCYAPDAVWGRSAQGPSTLTSPPSRRSQRCCRHDFALLPREPGFRKCHCFHDRVDLEGLVASGQGREQTSTASPKHAADVPASGVVLHVAHGHLERLRLAYLGANAKT